MTDWAPPPQGGPDPLPQDPSPEDGPPREQPPPYGAPYGQPPGYGPPGGHGPPPGYGRPLGEPGPEGQRPAMQGTDEITWSLAAYLGTLLVGFVAPLAVYFAKRNESPFVRFHAAQSLNHQITALIVMVVPLIAIVPPAILADQPAVLALWLIPVLFESVASYVVLIMGAIKAGKAVYYRFPKWLVFPIVR
ncbi:DUF4870 domain-containing protein [Actinomadura parmotrematis]|uniref:DUF4870 domain-containing protein n=1 Tax=Actinomadura parmotrematis TaxID=2864039 RepID=A0ABS7FTJ8_9ACTN|nr:DUF4870 domain-containing protein [Actinomadura parmotrematis]MBW8483733.1 DUF4870 domain-containing protein [Actinomadura parmotrematis]